MIEIKATLEEIRPKFHVQHPADEGRVQAIIDSLKSAADQQSNSLYRAWDLPPVVVVQDHGDGHAVLDGRHRLIAAERLGVEAVPAWVVSTIDYCRLVEANFNGSLPDQLADLRQYIKCGDCDANNVGNSGTTHVRPL